MGKLDTITKEYMSKPQYFADAFNSSVFRGKQIVKADELSLLELDPTELGILVKEDAQDIVKKVRDVLKKSILMNNGKIVFLLLGVENQSEIHYAMPVRNLLYDALNYGQQVNKIASKHRKKKDLKGAEFLSGFSRTDKIMPVITLTIYFGSDDWDAPRSLKEMFIENISEEILNEVDDYKLHLIVPKEIKDFSVFESDFGKAMEFIACCEDPEAIKKLTTDKSFEKVCADTVYLINACTGSDIGISKGEEVVDMCRGIELLKEEVRAEEKMNNAKFIVESIDNLIANLGLSLESACNVIGSSVQRYEESKKLLFMNKENGITR